MKNLKCFRSQLFCVPLIVFLSACSSGSSTSSDTSDLEASSDPEIDVVVGAPVVVPNDSDVVIDDGQNEPEVAPEVIPLPEPSTPAPLPAAPDPVVGGLGGIASNTGIAEQPLASDVMFTQARPEAINLDFLNDANGFSTTLLPEQGFGSNVVSLGDVTGDGLPDFSVNIGDSTLIIFGGSDNFQNLDIINLSAQQGITLNLDVELIPVGDLNNDGIEDLAWDTFDGVTGATGVLVVFGRSGDQLMSAIENTLLGVDGFSVSNSQRLSDVRSITAAGDFNADGFDDIVIGGFGNNSLDPDAPNAWVIYGSASIFSNTDIDVTTLGTQQGFSLTSPLPAEQVAAIGDSGFSGFDITAAGDIDFNADGVSDIAIGTLWVDRLAGTQETRSYVLFGSSVLPAGSVNITELNGSDGVRLIWPESSENIFVNNVGDLDANGFNDLGVSVDGVSAAVFSGSGISGAVVEGVDLPAGSATQITDGDQFNGVSFISKVGDLDGNGADELGVLLRSGELAVVYGDSSAWPATIDLVDRTNADFTLLPGLGQAVSSAGDTPLVALGDTNNDGLDDLAIGWINQFFMSGVVAIDDINGDGVPDRQIDNDDTSSVQLLRVLFGFGPAGFTGLTGEPALVQPVVRVGEQRFIELIDSINLAGNFAIDTLNTNLTAGIDSGDAADACVANASQNTGSAITAFECADAPVTFAYEFVSFTGSGTAQALFQSLSLSEGVVQTASYSASPVLETFFGPLFQAFFEYDANGVVALNNGREGGENAIPRLTCTIAVATRIMEETLEACGPLVGDTTANLNDLYGVPSLAFDLRLMP